MEQLWRTAKSFVEKVDNTFDKAIAFDKVKVAMYVTWLWAWAGLHTTKVFEAFFRTILKMPDEWLAFPVGDVVNTAGKKVKILSARTEHQNITNKLKLFVKLYWEKGGPTDANSTNGFDFAKLSKLLNCSVLYCCYLLTDAKGDIPPEQFWDSVHRFLIEQGKNGDCYKSTKVDFSDKSKLWLRNVDFEGNGLSSIIDREDSLDELDDELDAMMRSGTSLEKRSKPMVLEDILASTKIIKDD